VRSLSPDEAGLWAKVMATVKPLRGVAPIPVQKAEPALAKAPAPPVVTKPKTQGPGTTLDGGWDRRIARGIVSPDTSIDLHGHTLASAHSMLDHGLERAIARGDRVLLLVTGKPPRAESERPHARGAIRAAVADWIASSRHASAIAAVRGAHPRHGGSGALYIVLRRGR
jgi:DNA-nicking Smr family endonuclease